MKVVYISGPFVGDGTKKSIEQNIQRAKEYATVLANKKIGIFCPHLYNLDLDEKDLTKRQRYFYDLDGELLVRSDAVVVLPDWEKSFGARHEIKIAEELKLPIFYPKSVSDLDEVEKWYFSDDAKENTGTGTNSDKVTDIRSAMSRYMFKAV